MVRCLCMFNKIHIVIHINTPMVPFSIPTIASRRETQNEESGKHEKRVNQPSLQICPSLPCLSTYMLSLHHQKSARSPVLSVFHSCSSLHFFIYKCWLIRSSEIDRLPMFPPRDSLLRKQNRNSSRANVLA